MYIDMYKIHRYKYVSIGTIVYKSKYLDLIYTHTYLHSALRVKPTISFLVALLRSLCPSFLEFMYFNYLFHEIN